MVAAKDIVIFMKGVPTAPQCGFSNAVVQILKMHGVEDYNAHNVLEENEIREVRLKRFCYSPDHCKCGGLSSVLQFFCTFFLCFTL